MRKTIELHFDDKNSSAFITAAYIDNAVLFEWRFGYQFGRQVLYLYDFFLGPVEWEQGVEQTDDQIGMFSEYFLECKVGFWVEVSHIVFLFILPVSSSKGTFIFHGIKVLRYFHCSLSGRYRIADGVCLS